MTGGPAGGQGAGRPSAASLASANAAAHITGGGASLSALEAEADSAAPGQSLTKSLMRSMRWLFVFSVAANLLMLAMPIHMIAVYDRVLVSGSNETLLYITLMALAALVLLGITEAVRMMLAQRMAARYVTGMAGPLFSGLIHDEEIGSGKSQLMRDFYALRSFMAGRALLGLFDLPFTPIFLILLFALHVHLGFLTLGGIIVLAALAFANRKLAAKASEQATRANSDAVSFSQAVLGRDEDIRAMGLFPTFLQRWGSKMEGALNHADEAASVEATFFGVSRFFRQGLQIVIMAWGAYLVLGGNLSGGVIFAASLISGRAFVPVEQVIGSWDRVVHAWGAWGNLRDFIDAAPARSTAIVPQMTVGDVDVEGARFDVVSGNRQVTILDGINFRLPSGNVLAVIGPTGAGKSTLAKMLAGAIQPSQGSIRLDDFELALWPDARRGSSIGYVPQDARIFPGTIAENISRYEAYPDEDRIIEAARRAGIHSQIAKMPDAYATVLGTDNHSLSGGQQQQVALARAFYASPRVLVLDEPNAHLDQVSEDALLRALSQARDEGVSSIVVSQRRSILKVADFVLTMNEGRAVSFKENHGQWRARHSDDRADVPAPGIATPGAPKPEVTVRALNKAAPRRSGAVRVEGGSRP